MTAALLFQVATVFVCPCQAAPVEPPSALCSKPGLVVTWGGDEVLTLDLEALGPTAVLWEAESLTLTKGRHTVRPALVWPGYTDPTYRAEQDRGERIVFVKVCGQWWGHARLDEPGGSVVYPMSVSGKW